MGVDPKSRNSRTRERENLFESHVKLLKFTREMTEKRERSWKIESKKRTTF